jgi:hypothetical protein
MAAIMARDIGLKPVCGWGSRGLPDHHQAMISHGTLELRIVVLFVYSQAIHLANVNCPETNEIECVVLQKFQSRISCRRGLPGLVGSKVSPRVLKVG